MRVKIAVLLGFMVPLSAMELGKMDESSVSSLSTHASEEERPMLKLALMTRGNRIDTQLHDPNSPYAKYVTDAHMLITSISFFEREYPEIEVSKTLKYYDDTYPTAYSKFLARVNKIKDGTEQSEEYKGKVIIEFLQLMHAFRYDNASMHKADKEELAVAKEGLEGERSQLQEQKAAQEVRAKNANWRSVGAAAGGMIVATVTGLASWFAHPSNGATTAPAVCAVINATARLL